MKTAILLLLALLISSKNFAQEIPAAYAVSEGFNFWNLQEGATAYVIADEAYIRAYPSTSARLLDSVVVGTAVKIISIGYNDNIIRGFYAPWHMISYQKNNETKTGFIWLGLLALSRHVDSEGTQYLFGFDRFITAGDDTSDYYRCDLKLLDRKGQLIQKYNFHYDYLDQGYFSSELLPNMGLKGLKNILKVEFSGEACGIPTEYYYVGWNGDDFVDLPKHYTVSDAGIFYYEETMLFPSQHKKGNNLVFKMIEEGVAEDTDLEDAEMTITKRQETYVWDGKVLSQVIELK